MREPEEQAAAYPVARVVRKYPPPKDPAEGLLDEFYWCLDHNAPAEHVCHHKLQCRLEKRVAVPKHAVEHTTVEPGYTVQWKVTNMTTIFYWSVEHL